MNNNKALFGLDQNVAAGLSYLLGPFTGLFFYIGEVASGSKNKYVMFHALQSTIFMSILYVIRFALVLIRWIPFVGFFAGIAVTILNIAIIISLIFLMVMAFSGKVYKIPIIGDSCYKQVSKD
ncbi:MAG: hypothetical protein FWD82_01725 [Defluviitaleaceae bacterium]|nr:hypothetical protein [Defluviitaleaceae bacterium]